MRKTGKYVWLFIAMVAGVVMAACSSDGDGETGGVAEYGIKYYNAPSYVGRQQGYWYLGSESGERYIELTPVTTAPYRLLVKATSERGMRALDYLKQKPAPIQQVLELSDSILQVWSDKYLECPSLYVSDSYTSSSSYMREDDFILIDNCIIISLNDGETIDAIRQKYQDVMELGRVREPLHQGNTTRYTTYFFDTNLSNSYEVLRLAEEIYHRADVRWAEPNMYMPINFNTCW